MFHDSTEIPPQEERKDVFAPVADLMVGVVFVFIVLVMALSLAITQKEEGVPEEEYRRVALALQESVEQQRVLFARVEAERASRQRLADFVREVRDSSVVPIVRNAVGTSERRSEILRRLQEALSSSGIAIDVDYDRGTLRLQSTHLFESAQSVPTALGVSVIQQVGLRLGEIVPCFLSDSLSGSCSTLPGEGYLSAVYVEGHTDAAVFAGPEGSRGNWDLSAARSIEAFRIMTGAVPALLDLRNGENETLVGVSGYAETRPVSKGNTQDVRMLPEVRNEDRRIEIRFVMAVDHAAIREDYDRFTRGLGRIDADLR